MTDRRVIHAYASFDDNWDRSTIVLWNDGHDYFFGATQEPAPFPLVVAQSARLIPRSYYLARADGLTIFEPRQGEQVCHKTRRFNAEPQHRSGGVSQDL